MIPRMNGRMHSKLGFWLAAQPAAPVRTYKQLAALASEELDAHVTPNTISRLVNELEELKHLRRETRGAGGTWMTAAAELQAEVDQLREEVKELRSELDTLTRWWHEDNEDAVERQPL